MRRDRPADGGRRRALFAIGLLVTAAVVATVVALRGDDEPPSLPALLRSGRFMGESVTVEGRVASRLPSGSFTISVDRVDEPLLVVPGARTAVPDVGDGRRLRIAGTLDRVDEATGVPGPPSDTLADNAPLIRAQRIEPAEPA